MSTINSKEDTMNADSSTEWDHHKLNKAAAELRRLARIEDDLIGKLPAGIHAVEERCYRGDDRDAFDHAADFIEHSLAGKKPA